MPEPLDTALAEVRALLLDDALVRAVASGRRRNTTPRWTRVELRPVALADGCRLQVIEHDAVRPLTRNVLPGESAVAAVDEVLAEPFANWYVQTTGLTLQLRVTKRGEAQVHRVVGDQPSAGAAPAGGAGPASGTVPTDGPARRAGPASGTGSAGDPAFAGGSGAGRAAPHDRAAEHLLDPGDPLFDVIGGNAAKRRQVDAFLRALAATLDLPAAGTGLPQPLRVVDLGCGNAYLTFAAYRYLASTGLEVRITGVDIREDQRLRNADLAGRLGWSDRVEFRAGTIAGSDVDAADLVLALHACDTATDDALARAVRWQAGWILAAPCCHHDIAAQLRRHPPPAPYEMLTRHGILRERLADVLTDALRAVLLRLHGYQVDVVEFVDSAHTPRNVLLRARRTGAVPTDVQRAEYAALVDAWHLTPHLARLLGDTRPLR